MTLAFPLKRTVLAMVLGLLAGCTPMLTRSEYLWGAYATKADDLYVIRHVAELREDALPIPERSAPHLVSERFEVVIADLTGQSTVRPVEFRMIPPDMPPPADYGYVALDEDGTVELWGKEALSRHLKSAGKIACSGSVQYDEQDARVLYYRCDDEGLAYRFEPPYQEACVIRLGPQGGIPHAATDDYQFRSVAGQKVAYVTVGWGFLYEVDLCRDAPARELNRFARPDEALAQRSKSLPTWAEVNRLPHRLLGISETSRIYQVQQGADEEVVTVAADGTTKRYPIPGELAHLGEGRYLAQSGLIVWNTMDEQAHLHILHALNLASGVLTKTEIPF